MVDFRIDVVIDPTSANAGAKSVEASLDSIDNKADKVRTSLRTAFAPRIGGGDTPGAAISAGLTDATRRADGLGTSLDKALRPRDAGTGRFLPGFKKDLDETASAAGRTSLELGRLFALVGGAAALTSGVRVLAGYEQALANVRAVAGATAEQFEVIREVTQRLGLSTRFSATEAADSLGELARAGFTVQESLEAVEATLTLATAGGLDLRTATDIAASALRGFRLETTQTGRVADVLAQAANASNTSVQELGEALKFVGPVATGLRQSFEGTNAALGVLSDAGLKASLAGTGLRRVLSELESPSKASQEILASLGLTADDVRVSQVGLVEALTRLKEASIDTGTAIELFGDRGGPAFEVLSNNIPRILKLTEVLEKSGGTAKKVAADIDNNLQGALLRVQKAYQGLIISLGDAGGTNALTNTFNNVTAALKFLADNTELTGSALTIFAGILVARVVPGINLVTKATVSANPVLAAFAATATAATIVFGKLADEYATIDENLKQLEKDAKFGQLGAQIRQAQQELNNLSKIQEQSGKLSETQAARVQLLKNRIAELRTESKKEAEDNAKLKAARDANTTSVENSLLTLDRRIARLRQSSRESELAAQAEAELNKLLDAGIVPTQTDQAAITAKLQLIQALQAQREALDAIKGPQEAALRQQEALNGLLAAGKITTGEYNAAVSALRSELEKAGAIDPFADTLQGLRDAIVLENTRLRQGEIAAQAVSIEQELRRQGITLTREQQDELAKLLIKQKEISDEQEKINKARQEAEAQQRRREQLLAELDIGAQLIEQEAELEALRATRPDLENQIAAALDNVRIRALEASNTLEAGFQRAFLKIKKESEDFAAVGEAIVSTFADKATDALTEFATTGQFAFKEFASAILKDLTRIIARLLVVQALNAAIGALSGGSGAPPPSTTVSGQFADGGTTQPGRSYLVGERGPELFTPGKTGSVQPIAPAAASNPPPVIQVVNVSDPDEVPNVIASGRTDDSILNVLARNPDRVKQLIQ